jgi:two-component system response regulator FixJ
MLRIGAGATGWEIAAMAKAPLVHVVDDDASIRDSLSLLLGAAGFAVRTYDSAVAFLQGAADRGTGCVLTDVQMPELNGIELQRRMTELGIRLPVIVMTGHGDVPIAVEALKAGALDFLEEEHLLQAVREAIEVSQKQHDEAAAVADITARLATLTPREREVLERLLAGQPNKTIAYDLGSSPRTVEVHRARVMEKMGARSLAELVRMTLAVEREALSKAPAR